MLIYKITNKVDGKIYVGKTTKTLEERLKKHRYTHKQVDTYLYKAMRKYGFDNFEISVIEHCVGDIDERERHWISELNPEYNMTVGGDGGDTSNSPNFKQGVANHHSKRTHYPGSRMLGKTQSEETRAKQAQSRAAYWATLDDNERERRSKRVSGSNNGMFGKTPKNSLRVEFKGVMYASLTEATRETGHSAKYLKKHGILHYEQSN